MNDDSWPSSPSFFSCSECVLAVCYLPRRQCSQWKCCFMVFFVHFGLFSLLLILLLICYPSSCYCDFSLESLYYRKTRSRKVWLLSSGGWRQRSKCTMQMEASWKNVNSLHVCKHMCKNNAPFFVFLQKTHFVVVITYRGTVHWITVNLVSSTCCSPRTLKCNRFKHHLAQSAFSRSVLTHIIVIIKGMWLDRAPPNMRQNIKQSRLT